MVMSVPRTLTDRSRVLDLPEAERLLPVVRALARRINRRVALRARVERQLAILQLLSDATPRPGPELDELVDQSVRFHRLGGQIDALADRLASLGCTVRNRDATHVDFTILRPDGLAVLCWHRDEDRIGHWHFLHEEHAVRRELAPATN
jgi:hypothetical protein